MDYRTAAKELSKGKPWPIYVCYGTETYLMREFVSFAVDKLVDPDVREVATIRFDCAETPLDAVIDEAETMPFLAPRKVVIATNALFLTGTKESGRVEHRTERLLEYLKRPADHTVLVLAVEAEKLDERKKAVKALKERKRLLSFQPMSEEELLAWADKQAERHGFRLTPDGARQLLLNTGGSLRTIAQEIGKLALYAGEGGVVDAAAVDRLVARTPEQNVFLLVDHIVHLRVREALDTLHDLLLQKEEPIKIAALVARQYRIMLQAKELIGQGYSYQQAASQLGLHPYAVKLAAEQARRYPIGKLADILSEMAELDYRMKTGQIDKTLGLEMFLLKLAQ